MDAIVIGAGPAGLAVAAGLVGKGMETRIFERSGRVADAWHRHYDRLHLHSPKSRSSLPGLPMPADYPRYPSRAQVVDYLNAYVRHCGLAPELGVEVTAVVPGGGGWCVKYSGGEAHANHVVFATGLSNRPHLPHWPGMETFPGALVHSSGYRNPSPFAGKSVLVVGFGNSGGEIALDLSEAGCRVEIVVRGPVNILPRELFGIPIVSYEILQKILPYKIADMITAPVLRLVVGDYAKYGLQKSPLGPIAQVREEGRVPLIDIGTLAAIREGRIGVRPGIERFEGSDVVFADGSRARPDAVVLATGYRSDLRGILGDLPAVLDDTGRPRICGAPSGIPGLWFCSYHATPNGQLRQIGVEARGIAAGIAAA